MELYALRQSIRLLASALSMTNISANKNSETAIIVTGQAVAAAEPVAEMVEE
jgi:hypothetical protein